MKDFSILISVSNARIRNAIKNEGYENVAQFCKAHNLSQCLVGGILNFKILPYNKKTGEWRKVVYQIADALRMLPEDMFSQMQKSLTVESNKTTTEISEEQLIAIAESQFESLRRIQQSDDKALDEISDSEREVLIGKALALLPSRSALVVRSVHGIGANKKTYRELADALGVSNARVQEIYKRGLRLLKERAIKELIQANKYT